MEKSVLVLVIYQVPTFNKTEKKTKNERGKERHAEVADLQLAIMERVQYA